MTSAGDQEPSHGRWRARRRCPSVGRYICTDGRSEHTMGYFANAEEVYTYIGGVFREAADHETQGPKMAAAGITMALHYTDPECDLTVRFHEPRLEIVEGADDGPADIHLYMRADDAHRFWRGEYNLAVGLAKGQVKA